MKKLLANLDERWVKAASNELCDQLKELLCSEKFQSYKKVLAWTSFFPGEVDLTYLISELAEQKTFYLPRSHADGSMVYISIGSDWRDEVSPGEFGIPEPSIQAGTRFDPEHDGHETVVLVPGMAFDRLGNRLGRGKGYYDRFLGIPSMKSAKKVGVIWRLQLLENIPIETHDVPVDFVCLEDGVLTAELS